MDAKLVFMDEPTTCEWLRGDLFRITDPNTGISRIIEASVLAVCISNSARAYADYRARQSAEVIEFPKRHAASS